MLFTWHYSTHIDTLCPSKLLNRPDAHLPKFLDPTSACRPQYLPMLPGENRGSCKIYPDEPESPGAACCIRLQVSSLKTGPQR